VKIVKRLFDGHFWGRCETQGSLGFVGRSISRLLRGFMQRAFVYYLKNFFVASAT